MIKTLLELISYLKNPILVNDINRSFSYRLTIFLHLFFICLISVFFVGPLIAILETLDLANLDNHANDWLTENYSGLKIFFFGAVLAPLFEELIFRAPLILFKNPKWFGFAFYSFDVAFGLFHYFNFDSNTNSILLAPILCLPQILLGFIFGFIRVKFNLLWSILLHSFYNGFLMASFYLVSP